MWNIEEIKAKKRQIIKRIKNCTNPKEKEKLELTLKTYIVMIDNIGTIRHTKIYNLMDKLTKGHFILLRPSERLIINGEFINNLSKDFMDDYYLSFLIELCENISENNKIINNFIDIKLSEYNIKDEDLIKLSKQFYLNLGDKEIYTCAKKILDDPTALNFNKEFTNNLKSAHGITFHDFTYNKVYCAIKRNNTFLDLQANNHEIMHGVDFYIHKKDSTESYHGFQEVPTYTMDYLFIDYLDTLNLDQLEVQKLRIQKDLYIKNLATLTSIEIRSKIISKKNLSKLKTFTVNDVKEIMNDTILKRLLELESGIIAYGIYRQIEENFEQGLNTLKTFMKTTLPKDKKPDFSNIGLTEEKILNLSKEFGDYSKNNQSSKNYIRKLNKNT